MWRSKILKEASALSHTSQEFGSVCPDSSPHSGLCSDEQLRGLCVSMQ
jgi:hypothetical protein